MQPGLCVTTRPVASSVTTPSSSASSAARASASCALRKRSAARSEVIWPLESLRRISRIRRASAAAPSHCRANGVKSSSRLRPSRVARASGPIVSAPSELPLGQHVTIRWQALEQKGHAAADLQRAKVGNAGEVKSIAIGIENCVAAIDQQPERQAGEEFVDVYLARIRAPGLE